MRFLITILLFSFAFESMGQLIVANPPYKRRVAQSVVAPLDVVTGAAWAFSLRKLRTAYTGNCLRVRRTSDNTEQDIAFIGTNIIDTPSLKSFVGSSHGRVVTWYNQAGAVNATSSDTASQPYIVYAGNVIYYAGKPSVSQRDPGDTSNAALWKHLRILSSGTGISTFFSALYFTAGGTTFIEIPFTSEFFFYAQTGSGSAANGGSGTPSFFVNGVAKTVSTRGDAWNAMVFNSKLNILTATNFNTSAWTSFYTENSAASFVTGPAFISEMVMFYSDKSSDRAYMENNLNSFYNSY